MHQCSTMTNEVKQEDVLRKCRLTRINCRKTKDILLETSLESKMILWHPYEGHETRMTQEP
jgi:hypothetical protein